MVFKELKIAKILRATCKVHLKISSSCASAFGRNDFVTYVNYIRY